MKLLKPKFLIEWNEIRKEGGYKLLIKKKGRNVVIAFIVFYFVRDSILYLLIPYLAIKGIITCN